MEAKTISLKNDLRQLDVLHEHIEEFADPLGFSARELFEINLAVEELFTNVVSYAYADKAPHEILVTLAYGDGKLAITISDDGVPFNPLNAKAPDVHAPPEDRPIGKMGIFLTQKVMDGMEYQRKGQRNVVTLYKKHETETARQGEGRT